eukprot:TRINITY_DN520_c0_g1_i2.p2 TRINITY_DN520_c0_g1~~TRINITY_DN520_c0_g1_i2.p2  ORF type:complete len:164 (-),score=42.95 TRINITY_DN520_c0_g1_i2:145-636(-)
MRFKENQQAAEQPHLTNNGSPDMRYKENQQAAAAAGTEHIKQDGPEHVKQDGTTPDMRFKENKEEEEEPEHVKQDGTPDMRFKENQQAAAEPEHVKQDGTRQAGRQPGHALQGEQRRGHDRLDRVQPQAQAPGRQARCRPTATEGLWRRPTARPQALAHVPAY